MYVLCFVQMKDADLSATICIKNTLWVGYHPLTVYIMTWNSSAYAVCGWTSRLTWDTTSLRNCASLPQAYSVGRPVRVAVCTGAAVPLRIGKHLSILEHQVTIRNKIMRKVFILNLQKYLCTVLLCAYSS
jgi:hypothetical protein